MMGSVLLYRPVGLKELELIAAANFVAFPPRLPEQPIFYPVLNFAYAEQIARDWNTKTNAFAGFVARFEIDPVYAATFEVHTVGNRTHQELWVPADELAEFNRHILGQIEVVAAYYGEQFVGEMDPATNLPVFAVPGNSPRTSPKMTPNNLEGRAVAVPSDDPDMQQAFLETRRTMDQFIQHLRAPTLTEEYFAVKVRFSETVQSEYLWMSGVSYDGVMFAGKLEGESDLLPLNYQPDNKYRAPLDAIYDWMIVDNGKLIGGYTIRVARRKMTPENRERFDEQLWFTVE